MIRTALCALVLLWAGDVRAASPEVTLVVREDVVDIAGAATSAMTFDGEIPGPTLRWRLGDLARIRVHNQMDVATSVHWHGLLLPNREDGVPGLTTPPIPPGGSHLFEFPIRQTGTYWYHSHSGLQEQRGLYGSIVIDEEDEAEATERDFVVVLSDWTQRPPATVMRMLKRGSDRFAYEKGTLQTLWGAARDQALGATLRRSLERMPPMDLSDVAYDAFLINGRREETLRGRPGERVRLRVINGSASTYFYLEAAGRPLEVVAADGLAVDTLRTPRLLVAVAETYDLIVQIPASGAYEFRATAQDGSGFASLWVGEGEGERRAAGGPPRPPVYPAPHAGHAGHAPSESAPTASPSHHAPAPSSPMAPGHHDHHPRPETADKRPLPPYDALRSRRPSTFPDDAPRRSIHLTLTGDMERYVWSFDGVVLSEADLLPVGRGEVLRITLENTTMMHHPLHLHGHFFRVLNGQGEHAPWKHTVDVPPMGTRTIEFAGDEEGDWFFHCHVLYHMKAGMARVFRSEGWAPDPELEDARRAVFRDPWFPSAEVSVFSHYAEGELRASSSRHGLGVGWELGWQRQDGLEREILPLYRYHHNRFYRLFAGGSFENDRDVGVFGVEALLPLNLESRVWVDTAGDGRFALEKQLQLTRRLATSGGSEYDTNGGWEGHVGLRWRTREHLDLGVRWHSEYGWGGGVELRF